MARKVRLPLLVQDRQNLFDQDSRSPGEAPVLATPIEWLEVKGAEGFADGPACPQVVVEDVDAETGARRAGARWLPRGVGRSTGCYEVNVPDIDDTEALLQAFESDAFLQVSPFATVLRTIQFFESPDALGRPVTWAFRDPRIRIIPRAGTSANACYRRASGSLEFYSFQGRSGRTVHTALSHDIVVHETAHAILDGIAPGLYDATRTESIALHEAVADLAAIVLTLLNEMVVFSLYNISGSKVDIAGALAKVAEEFGSEVQSETGVDALRVLKNRRALDGASTNLVAPYEVSEVLSGAAFQVFIHCANGPGLEELSRRQKLRRDTVGSKRQLVESWGHTLPDSFDQLDEKRVNGAARDIARLVFRALDYLPPGEASLADFGRAVVASNRAVRSGRTTVEGLFVHELVERGVVADASDLEESSQHVGRVLEGVDCTALLEDPALAVRFAEEHRALLGVPSGRAFRVQPRRSRIRSRGRSSRRDLVFRVTWDEWEEHDIGPGFGTSWAVSAGTTLVLDWETSRVLSVLTTETGDRAWADRDRTLKSWQERGLLHLAPDRHSLDIDEDRILVARRSPEGMRVSGAARVLCT